MKTMKRRLMALFMVVIMCVISPLAATQVSAEGDYEVLLEETGTLDGSSQTTASHSFYNSKQQAVIIDIIVNKIPAVSMKLENLDTQEVMTRDITAADWYYNEKYGDYELYFSVTLAAGNYTITLDSAEAFNYSIGAIVIKDTLKLSDTSITITAGQKKTLKVTNTEETVKWSSNKKSVATVSSKGVVTAKKAGTATITATVGDKKATCKVKVQKNVYSAKRATLSDVNQSGLTPQIYHMSYKNGTIVCKVNLLNNSYQKVTNLNNVVITINSSSGKKIASQKFKSKKVSISAYGRKSVTFVIDKKHVKNKKADLVNAKWDLDGKYQYR